MSECVGNVERSTVSTQIQITGISSVELISAGRNFGDLRKEWSRVNAEYAHFILESIGDVEPCSVAVEECFFTVEAGFENSDESVGGRVDHTGEVRILVQH